MKILIIGVVASGKTTFAKKLSSQLGIEYYEIASIVHDDIHKQKRTEKEQQKIIEKINANANWIMEGTLRKNLYYLMKMTDKIIYLDIPVRIRKRRIITRFIKQRLGIEKCNYYPSFEILKLMFYWTSRFECEKLEFETSLSSYADKLIVLKNKKEMDLYIRKVKLFE